MPARKLLAYAAIYILWSGSFLAIREIVAVVPPLFAAGFRFTLAGAVLLLVSAGGTAARHDGRPEARDLLGDRATRRF